MIETKTKAYIVRGRVQGLRYLPCFINGSLPRPRGVTKVQVWYFDGDGELIMALIPSKFVQEAQFKLT